MITIVKNGSCDMENHLKEIRIAKRMTLRYLSKLSGISNANINKIENNLVIPNICTVCALAKALHVDIEDIFPCTRHKIKGDESNGQ